MTTARTRPATPGGQVRVAFGCAVVAGLLAVALAAVTSGSAAAAGALLGTLLVLFFFGFGSLVVNAVASVSPTASLLVALLTYTLEVVALGAVFVALGRSGALGDSVDGGWIGVVVIALTLVWLAAQTFAALRSRQPLYDLSATRRRVRDDPS
jgi:ATP synthase protein I